MLNKLLSRISIRCIRLYQLILSPDKGIPSLRLKGKVCRHEPHCSQYALEYTLRFGLFKSIIPIMDRVSNCTAGYGKIIDPVPDNPTKLQSYKATKSDNPKSLKHGSIEALKPLRVVFFSSAPIGIRFLEELHTDSRFQIVGAVTQPNQPAGRGLEMKPNIIKTKAEELDIYNISTPNTLRLESKKYPGEGESFQSWLHNLEPDYIVVIAYGKIVPQHILDIPKIAPINIHGSLLPLYRGASPIQTCLLNGDKETGITIMKMSAGLDEGDIIKQLRIPLEIQTTTADLIHQFSIDGPKFTNDTLRELYNGERNYIPQDNSKATITKKIEKEDGLIDIYNEPFEQVLRKYNAYFLRPKIYFIHNNKRVVIDTIEIIPENYKQFLARKEQDNHFNYTTIDKSNNTNPIIKNLIVRPEGKKNMSRGERKRGYLK